MVFTYTQEEFYVKQKYDAIIHHAQNTGLQFLASEHHQWSFIQGKIYKD